MQIDAIMQLSLKGNSIMKQKTKLEHRVTVNLTQEQNIRLQKLSLEEGLPVALIIRQAIGNYLTKKQSKSSSAIDE